MTTFSRMQVYVCPRVLRRAFLLLAAVLLVLGSAADGAAQGRRRARLSEDLAHRLSRGDVAPTRVIVTGTQAEVDRLARRHGLAVRKRLQSPSKVRFLMRQRSKLLRAKHPLRRRKTNASGGTS